MNQEPIIEIRNVSKSFLLPHLQSKTLKNSFVNVFKNSDKATRQVALKDISFTVNKGDFFGIVGRNGSGKSTLLKILANIYQPTSGSVVVKGTLMPFIELGVGFNPELTGRENVYLNGAILGKTKKEIDKDYREIVEFAELEQHMDKKLKNYSSGMQVRLAFACATKTNTDILVVDEILAVGDTAFQNKCFRYFKELKQINKTVVLVTHDMSSVLEYCNKAVLIEDGVIENQGTVGQVAAAYNELFNPLVSDKAEVTRWGNEKMMIHGVEAFVDKKNNSIELSFYVKSQGALKGGNVIVAYAIKNEVGQMLFGNKIRRDNFMIDYGKSTLFKFQIDNILSKGKYYIDVSLLDADTNQYYDCWINCCLFESNLAGVEGYSIIPKDRLITGNSK